MTTAPMPVGECRNCGADTETFLDHGKLPISNQFTVTTDERVSTYPIAYAFCPQCFLVQICQDVPPAALFADEYAFLTSSSDHMVEHYKTMASDLRERWNPRSVIEIGPNDGALLQHFRDLVHLGFEPSANVAQMARSKGLNIDETFFGYSNMTEEFKEHVRPVDLVLGCHVATHLPNQHDFFAGVATVLDRKGVLVMEDPSLLEVIKNGEWDQLYEEHVCVYGLSALAKLAGKHGLALIDAEPQPVHGGSLRVTFGHDGAHKPSPRAVKRLLEETVLANPDTYRAFGRETADRLRRFKETVLRLKSEGKRVAGYGATSKSSIPLVRCGFGPETIEYITDSTPTKQGRYAPGSGIPIVSREQADAIGLPDVFVLFPYNHRREILAKETGRFRGQWLEYVPDIRLTA